MALAVIAAVVEVPSLNRVCLSSSEVVEENPSIALLCLHERELVEAQVSGLPAQPPPPLALLVHAPPPVGQSAHGTTAHRGLFDLE